MLLRWSLGLVVSVLAHLGVVAICLFLGASSFSGPVDVEIAGVNLEEIKDLPLGGPQAGEARSGASARMRSRAPQAPAEGTMAERPGKDEKTSGTKPGDDEAGPAPTSDLGAYAPQGSRLTVLMRLDRLRGTDYAPPVGDLLMRLPDGQDFVRGTGLDLFGDLDALLVATPNPLDASVTFVAVRHRLDDAKVRAALTAGAKASDYTLTWRTQGGRPIGERHPLEARRRWRDDRLIVLAAPGLTVVTPRAYRALLLAPAASPGESGPTGGEGDGPDGGATAPPALKGGWATLLTRIDAEEGLMPADGAVMVNAVDIFKSRAPSPGEPPELYGMPIPAAINGVIGIADAPYLDVTAEFKTEAPAQQWETQWPTVQRKLRTHPLLVLSGFSTLVTRAKLEREGRIVRFHLAVSHDETLRLLTMASHFMTRRYGDSDGLPR
ncbi:MAG TPA: hypothetical protein VN903_26660 [Polyangia bacterium]|jgi:hypothetical protein|nr:hypothetical protein [Polyangia bacterium]